MSPNRISNIAALLNKHPLLSERIIKPGSRVSFMGFYALILAVVILMATVFFKPHLPSIMMLAILIEGSILIVIIMLYQRQFSDLKKLGEEKDRALAELENRMAAIEAAADGIAIINQDGQLIYFNLALQDIYAIPEDKIGKYIGEDWTKLFSQEGQRQIENIVMPKLEENGVWRGVSPVIRKDGTSVYAELMLTRLPDGSMVGTARDISEKQRSLKEKQILEQQFYQAQKMEAIGRLAGGIAHDFNNILAAIAGYAEFLEEDLDKKSKENQYAANILKATVQARDLVNQMLAFSRQHQSTKEAIDLMTPITESLSMIKASLPKSIIVKTKIQIPHAYIDGNSTQISQLIMNLCLNARDAMEDEQGELKLELKECDADGSGFPEIVKSALPPPDATPKIYLRDISARRTRLYMGVLSTTVKYACMTISDDGSGMSRAIMEHMFEPFFTTKSVDKGTGLGLATVHGIMTAHHGALVIDSEIGKGTSFTCFFPMTEKTETRDNANSSHAEKEIRGRILLVEDQEEVLLMLTETIKRLGHDVDCAKNGKEALMKLRKNPEAYDLVMTDHNMPVMSGFELIRQASILNPDLPFIIVSGYSAERLQELIKDHPSIVEILRKPVAKAVLQEKVSKALALREKGAS